VAQFDQRFYPNSRPCDKFNFWVFKTSCNSVFAEFEDSALFLSNHVLVLKEPKCTNLGPGILQFANLSGNQNTTFTPGLLWERVSPLLMFNPKGIEYVQICLKVSTAADYKICMGEKAKKYWVIYSITKPAIDWQLSLVSVASGLDQLACKSDKNWKELWPCLTVCTCIDMSNLCTLGINIAMPINQYFSSILVCKYTHSCTH